MSPGVGLRPIRLGQLRGGLGVPDHSPARVTQAGAVGRGAGE
jgi:hypothetical protein